MLLVQPSEQLKQNRNKKLLHFKRRAFIAECIPGERFNFVHLNSPGNFFLSHNTAMVYTGCYQCSPTEQLKENTNQKLFHFRGRAFIAECIPVKRFNFVHFNISEKIPCILQHSNGIYWMFSVHAPYQLKQNTNKNTAPIQKKSFHC